MSHNIAAIAVAASAAGDGSGDDGDGGDASVIDCYCCVQWQLDFFLSSLKFIHSTSTHTSEPPSTLFTMRNPHTIAGTLIRSFVRSFAHSFVRLLCVLAHLLVASVSFTPVHFGF